MLRVLVMVKVRIRVRVTVRVRIRVRSFYLPCEKLHGEDAANEDEEQDEHLWEQQGYSEG